MKLSIITINLNNKEGLIRTIESVRNQTFRDFEQIVIDGASTDGSLEVIKKYKDGFSFWVSEKDAGIYNAMNKGIEAAKGEYTLFLNSGDWLYADNVLARVFKNSFDEDIVSCGCHNVYPNKTYSIDKYPPKKISLYSLHNCSLSHPSTFIRRELFNRTSLYDESYRIISDWAFFVQSLICNNCSYSYLDILVTTFVCDGISSNTSASTVIKNESDDYISKNYPRVWNDYFMDECVFNTIRWIYNQNIFFRNVIIFPFRVFNSLFKLRTNLGNKKRIQKIKATKLIMQ